MLPLLMMGGDSGSRGGGNDGQQMEMLLRLMAPQLFREDTVEAVESDLVGFGTAKDRSGDATIGILEFMVLPPHAGDPRARLRIKTNGPILATPDDLDKLATEIKRIAESGRIKKAFEEQRKHEAEAEAEAQQAATMRAVAGRT